MTVRNVLIGEQQQPDRRPEHAQAGHQVQRRERYFGQAARAIERTPENSQQARRQHHQAGFFPVEAFEQREQGADQQQNGGQHPRGRQPATQPLGQQQAKYADQAGAKVRSIDQSMGDQKTDVFQARIDFRGDAGEQQDNTGQEHQHRQYRSRQTRGSAQRLACLEQALAFVDQQQQAGHQQGQDHVDQAIEQQGGRQWRSTQGVGKRRQQNGFEHPDTARHMAEHAGGQGQQVNQKERTEGWRFRQQQIEHGRGGRYVQGGDDQLQEGQATPGQTQGAAPDPDQQVVRVRLFRQPATVDTDGQHRKQHEHGARHYAKQCLGESQGGGRGRQVAERRQGGQRR
ncbi:hypothetical protein D3C84_458180 [compost metagenome]